MTGHETPEPQDFEKAQVEFVPLSSTGTAVFLAAVASGYLLGLPTTRMARLLAATVVRDDPGHRRDRLHAGARLRDEVLGNGRRPRPRVYPDRPAFLPHFRHAAGLAGRGPHRLGHVEQCPLRQPAEDHRA